MKKSYHISYQIWGNYTDSNLCGTGTIEAESEEQAVAFFKEDWTTPGMLSGVLIEGVEEDEEADPYADDNEECKNEDRERKCWNTSFSVSGKHGNYCGCGGPYAITEEEASRLQFKDLTSEDGLGDIEALDIEDWS